MAAVLSRPGCVIPRDLLTHWGRVTHICVSNLTIIGSDNGSSPCRRQAIIWTNAGILLIGPLGTNYSEIFIEIHTFSFKKMHLKMSSGKWLPFCLGLNMLTATHVFRLLSHTIHQRTAYSWISKQHATNPWIVNHCMTVDRNCDPQVSHDGADDDPTKAVKSVSVRCVIDTVGCKSLKAHGRLLAGHYRYQFHTGNSFTATPAPSWWIKTQVEFRMSHRFNITDLYQQPTMNEWHQKTIKLHKNIEIHKAHTNVS